MGFISKLISKILSIVQAPDEIRSSVQSAPQPRHISKHEAADEEHTNLYIGKVLDDGSIKCEVVDVHDTNIHVKILQIYWDRMGTYLDAGRIYPVYKHRGGIIPDDKMQIWEISSKHMKRSTSQVLLCWEKGIGWTWDLDF